jgi:hypothetical protein
MIAIISLQYLQHKIIEKLFFTLYNEFVEKHKKIFEKKHCFENT